MRFNFWLVVLLALGPLFILFAGLWAAGGFESQAGWAITGFAAAAALGAAYFARRDADAVALDVPDPASSTNLSGAAQRRDVVDQPGYSSPACLLHEVDPTYLGYAGREEIVALLNQLLEAERAGRRGARAMSALADSAATREALREVAEDEGRFCAMLYGHITRLGELPSRQTGTFHEKLAALERLDERLELLNRGQGWVVRKLSDAIPKIAEDSLRADLQAMLDVHASNIERCTRLVEPSRAAA